MGLTLTNNRHYLTCRAVSQSVATVPLKEKEMVTIFQNYWDLLSSESDIPEQIENTFLLYCTWIKYTKEPFRELPCYALCNQGVNKVLHSFKKLSLGASNCFCQQYWGSREAISEQSEVEHITPLYLGNQISSKSRVPEKFSFFNLCPVNEKVKLSISPKTSIVYCVSLWSPWE